MNIKEINRWDGKFKEIEDGEDVNIHGRGSYEKMKPFSGKVLDVGCGNIEYLSYAKQSKDNYLVGLDFSKKALELAKKKAKGKNIDLVRGAAQYLPFKDNSFDNVLCIELLPHETDYEKVLKEIHRTSNSNAFLTFHHKDEAIKTNLKLEGNIVEEEGRRRTYFDENEILKMLKEIGFGCDNMKIFKIEDIWGVSPLEQWPYYLPPLETKAVIQVECSKL
jgi:SAM-dependent methyltransferase